MDCCFTHNPLERVSVFYGYGKEIQYSTRAYTTEHTEPLVSLEQKDEDRLREQMRVTTNLRVYSFRLRGRAKL